MLTWLKDKLFTSHPSEFNPAWESALDQNLAVWHSLQERERSKLRRRIADFLDSKNFEGCNGLEVTQDMKLVIAAMACMLVVNTPAKAFPLCDTILVYPDKFTKIIKVPGPGGTIQEQQIIASGESWSALYGSASGGPVILSWRDVEAAAHGLTNGRNVVHHEFAHQLDALDGVMDGAPNLRDRATAQEWRQVFTREYSHLRHDLAHRVPTFIHPYGATSPAEFFAVATEHYFANPDEFQARHPDLYTQLHSFYNPCHDGAERSS